jgi:hypothetical protein
MKLEFQNNGKTVTYYRIDFILSNESQRYGKQPMIRDFKKIPTDLKIEETIDSKIKIRSEYLLRGRMVNGKCTLHLGLEKTQFPRVYRSALDDKKKSEVHIILSDDYRTMTIYVFNNFRVERPARLMFQIEFINHLRTLGEYGNELIK